MDPIYVAVLAACAFFAILFLQSGLDKIFDWKGNLDWLNGHFAKSPFHGMVPLLLGTLTVIEIATGITSAGAFVLLLFKMSFYLPRLAFAMACATFLMLFLGQRVAKDYVGAATIASYFAVALLSLFMSDILNR